MKIRVILVLLVIAFAASLAAAFHYRNQFELHRARQVAPAPVEVTPVATEEEILKAAVESPDPAAAYATQIHALLAALTERDALISSLRHSATNRTPPPDWGGRDRTNWLERIKQEDPKRYEEIVKAREEQRQRVNRSFAEKAEYLLRRDTTEMAEAEKAEYEQMVSLLNDTWLISEKLRTQDLSRDLRWETLRTLRGNMTLLAPMLQSERDRALFETGKQMGYSDSDAQAFVEYMSEIYDVTSLQDIYRGMREGRGGPGFDGPGPGAAPPPR